MIIFHNKRLTKNFHFMSRNQNKVLKHFHAVPLHSNKVPQEINLLKNSYSKGKDNLER